MPLTFAICQRWGGSEALWVISLRGTVRRCFSRALVYYCTMSVKIIRAATLQRGIFSFFSPAASSVPPFTYTRITLILFSISHPAWSKSFLHFNAVSHLLASVKVNLAPNGRNFPRLQLMLCRVTHARRRGYRMWSWRPRKGATTSFPPPIFSHYFLTGVL